MWSFRSVSALWEKMSQETDKPWNSSLLDYHNQDAVKQNLLFCFQLPVTNLSPLCSNPCEKPHYQ